MRRGLLQVLSILNYIDRQPIDNFGPNLPPLEPAP